MSESNLQQLERDVEAARAKLANDLTTLRSPATSAEFTSGLKVEALDLKDAAVAKVKASVQSTVDSFVTDLKGRVAANPAAALAIGAGIAWRLVRHPPIATALVGAGLYSLFRTTPVQTTRLTDDQYLAQGKERLVQQASDFATVVKDQAVALGEAAADKTAEIAVNVKDRAVTMGLAATASAAELGEAATAQAQHWSAEVRSSTRRMTNAAASAVGDATDSIEHMGRSATDEAIRYTARVGDAANEYVQPLKHTIDSQESRDSLLLGAAGVAVVAALGIAWQRRSSDSADR